MQIHRCSSMHAMMTPKHCSHTSQRDESEHGECAAVLGKMGTETYPAESRQHWEVLVNSCSLLAGSTLTHSSLPRENKSCVRQLVSVCVRQEYQHFGIEKPSRCIYRSVYRRVSVRPAAMDQQHHARSVHHQALSARRPRPGILDGDRALL